MIWFTSDFHFFHNREFVYKVRGFDTMEEMNSQILQNFNSVVQPEDDVYILGDLLLGGADSLEAGLNMLKQLNGRLHLVRGNHDTDKRWEAYATLPNIVEMQNAIYIKYNGYHFYLSHFPTLTSNLEKETLKQCTINLYAHTHQKSNFYQDIPFMYHVGVDSHNCFPIKIDDIIEEMKNKVKECVEEL